MTIIGIDLGTTNSLAAHWTKEGAKLIPNVYGEFLTPSIVSVDHTGELVIGRIAQERLLTHPEYTAAVFKRFMGTEKTYKLGPHTFNAEELSSFIIRSLKADAEIALGQPITEAVISVPAYFNDTQRKATKRAAELAGLRVERLISEPTAAAIAYGLHQEKQETQFLVVDLGGGTFDVSILEYFEGMMEVKSVAGDNYLGGEDFSELLQHYFIEQTGIDFASLDQKARAALLRQAEACKCALASAHQAHMHVQLGEHMYDLTLNRDLFEKVVNPLVLRLRQPIERALRDASLRAHDLDAIILIGGATRMPLIKSMISKMFGRLPYTHIHPDETVALGTAIQVALKQRDISLREVILTDVCPYTLGIETTKAYGQKQYDSGHFSPIIERNTPIPVSRVERYCTIHPNQRHIQVAIFQGESRRVENTIRLGEVQHPIPPGPAGQEAIDVRFTYDINGMLEVEITTISTGQKTTAIIEKEPGLLHKEDIEARLSQLAHIKVHPRDRSHNRLLLARGERLYEESLGDRRRDLAEMMQQFEHILASQQEQEIVKFARYFKNMLDDVERWNDE
ncbi:molecular chaperone HscC [Paenibacillus shirakamiensis]|uniref:Chaperone protein DnaK n=1 Tax=Paenibacillus shirakamiensis TaxID=1265935 RepID=A0ABS4JIG0_9BACL|nr:molecular chaperone HscC [Paenibacillus shirakamiensis]MBP2001503.1 molecular chaperone HscC [Paenibacillus shirakamiensis]